MYVSKMKADITKHNQINKNVTITVSGNITLTNNIQLFNNSGEEEVEHQVEEEICEDSNYNSPEPNSSLPLLQPVESPLRSNALTEARRESRLSGELSLQELKDDDIDGLIMASIASRDQPLDTTPNTKQSRENGTQHDEDSIIMQIMDPQSKLSLNEKRDNNN